MLSESHLLSERELVAAMGAALRSRVPSSVQTRPAAAPAAEVTPESVREALQQAGGNKSQAARALGLSRRAFYRRLESLGIR
jgi:transcriptional regulator of acetoin/glycerol metabolism